MIFTNEHLTRQSDIIPTKVLGEQITIIGAGAIGSWVTLALAKMGYSDLTVYDMDTVDTVNMNSQFYPFHAIGKNKAIALKDLVKDFTGTEINAIPHAYEKGMFPGIVISAVDSMAVRRLVWENHSGKSPFTKAVIDPRMGAETALLFVFSPMRTKDRLAYEKSLYADSEALQERCTAKATIYTANMLSGLVCKAVKDLTVTPEKHIRTAMWDIAKNEFLAFSN